MYYKEPVTPISIQDSFIITKGLKNTIGIPPELWQAPSHFDFFKQSNEIGDTESVLSWFHKTDSDKSAQDTYLTIILYYPMEKGIIMQSRFFRLIYSAIKNPSFSIKKPNPFDSEFMAGLYQRPEKIYLNAMRNITGHLKINGGDEVVALDVACGTGISTRAVAKILAKRVIGLDASENMLTYAKAEDNRITYQLGKAEELPFPDKSFNLLTICCALHCIDQEKFLSEAERVLKADGHLIILHSKLSGLEVERFRHWLNDVFYKKYPFFSGNRNYISDKNKSDLLLNHSNMFYPEHIDVNISETAELLMTTSGVFMAVEGHKENPAAIKAWLLKELSPYFSKHTTVPFRIDMSIWCFTKTPKLEFINTLKL